MELSPEEAQALSDIAHHYEDVMGKTRHVVVWTAPRHVRKKYRYIVQESRRLESVASEIVELVSAKGGRSATVSLTPTDAVQFWGRALSNLNSRRSRRKLAPADVEVREQLSSRFAFALLPLWQVGDAALIEAVKSRRGTEAAWMKTAFDGYAESDRGGSQTFAALSDGT